MKKLLIAAILTVASSALFSQVRFGLKAGVNFANMSIKDDASGLSVTPSNRTGFHVSAIADIPLSPLLYFQPGISVSEKGTMVKESGTETLYDDYYGAVNISETYESTVNPLYLEVPLNIVSKFEAGTGRFLVGAGPYIGYGIKGKTNSVTETSYTISGEENREKYTEKHDLFTEEGGLKRLDYGISLLTGYELNNGLFLNAGYQFGLNNILKESDGGSVKNKVLSVSLGYLF